jgi:hypothetical protein
LVFSELWITLSMNRKVTCLLISPAQVVPQSNKLLV